MCGRERWDRERDKLPVCGRERWDRERDKLPVCVEREMRQN